MTTMSTCVPDGDDDGGGDGDDSSSSVTNITVLGERNWAETGVIGALALDIARVRT